MDNPEGVGPALWAVLDGRLWHATSPGGLSGILRDGEIKSLKGRYDNSLCKMLDGISLMDFGPTATDQPLQASNWCRWFGHEQRSRVAIWIEINRQAVAEKLLEAQAARGLAGQGHHARRLIAGVEACHRGPIPVAAFVGILCIDSCDRSVFRSYAMADANGCAAAFEKPLPPEPPESPIIAGMRRGRERVERALKEKQRDEHS